MKPLMELSASLDTYRPNTAELFKVSPGYFFLYTIVVYMSFVARKKYFFSIHKIYICIYKISMKNKPHLRFITSASC